MGNKKSDLLVSQQRKFDEWYTLYDDIAAELPNYKSQLKGARIICPCDWDESFEEAIVYKEEGYIAPHNLISYGGTVKKIDIEHSKDRIERDIGNVKCNFIKFLVAHAEAYEIKSISVSGYNPETGEGVRFQDIDYSNYDIVITNPPFSQIGEFFNVMMSYPDLKFLVIGPQTAIGYKDCFNYIRDNRIWLGYHYHMSGFIRPDGSIVPKNDNHARSCCWFTNMYVSYRRDKMTLTKKYNPVDNPRYYNYDGIDVNRTLDIPYDYEGNMGVPLTFLQKYNPEQFEIVDANKLSPKTKRWSGDKASLWIEKDGKPFKCPFDRIIIRNKEVYHDED